MPRPHTDYEIRRPVSYWDDVEVELVDVGSWKL